MSKFSLEHITEEVSNYLTTGMHHSTPEGRAAITRIITTSVAESMQEELAQYGFKVRFTDDD